MHKALDVAHNEKSAWVLFSLLCSDCGNNPVFFATCVEDALREKGKIVNTGCGIE